MQQTFFHENIYAKNTIENQIQNSDNVSKSIWKIINDETKRTPEVTEGLSLATDGVKYSERL